MTEDRISGRTPDSGARGRLRHQGGFIRGAIILFLVLTVVGAFALDILSVYAAHRTLAEQTRDAAVAAATSYVQNASDAIAEETAAAYLSDHGSTLVKIVPDHTDGLNVYHVTAKRAAQTYFFHYLTGLPKVGKWIDRQLHPQVTGDNQ